MTQVSAPSLRPGVRGRWPEAGLLALNALAALAAIQFGLSAPYDHNEQMYASVGALLRDHALYAELPYVQMPLLPWLLWAVYAATGTTSYLLAGRFVSIALFLAAQALVGAIVHAATADRILALLAAAIFVILPGVAFSAGEISAYIHPVVPALAALWCLVRHRQGGPAALLFAAGALGAVSVGFRLTWLPFLAVLIGASALSSRRQQRSGAAGGLAALAGALGPSALPLAYFARDPAVFVFDNYGFHALTQAWRFPSRGLAIDLAYRAAKLVDHLVHRDAIQALVFTALLGLLALVPWRSLPPARRDVLALVGALLLAGVVSAVAPLPVSPQYMLHFLPLVPIFGALMLAEVQPAWALPGRWFAAVVAWAGLVTSPFVLLALEGGPKGGASPTEMHARAELVAHHLAGRAECEGLVTLRPLYGLEGGVPVSPLFATGPFIWRVADLVPAGERARLLVLAPADIEPWLDAHPPCGILVGFYGREIEGPITDWAISRGYTHVDEITWAALHVRP